MTDIDILEFAALNLEASNSLMGAKFASRIGSSSLLCENQNGHLLQLHSSDSNRHTVTNKKAVLRTCQRMQHAFMPYAHDKSLADGIRDAHRLLRFSVMHMTPS